MSRVVRVAAVDLGASSGRVLAVEVGPEILSLTEVYRFANEAVEVDGTLYWDVLGIFAGVETGLRLAARGGPVDAVGVDSWGVDYGLLDGDGRLLANPVGYRDGRTVGVPERVWAAVGRSELYAITGVQHQRFNTLFQLVAESGSARLGAARRLLMLPDLMAFWLTGRQCTEVTNASTTQLLDVRRRTWATELIDRLGLDAGLFLPPVEPGTVIGSVTDRVVDRTGLSPGTPVIAVGSHDTASAVAGVPARGPQFAYVSCGTWSLVGLELDQPVLSEASRAANFTNELGVDRTVRYLRNVMGLWLLQESMRAWTGAGGSYELADLLAAAQREEPGAALVDADDERFLAPGDMPVRIAEAVREAGGRVPATPAQTVRCIVDSLASAYARAVADATRISGHTVDTLHVVGGGSLNSLLCRLTAQATGLPVLAGPAEAAGLGNALVQARALGAVDGDRFALRDLIARTQDIRRYAPGQRTCSPGPAQHGPAQRRPASNPTPGRRATTAHERSTSTMSQLSLSDALDAMGKAGARLDQIHACEAGAGNISVSFGRGVEPGEIFPLSEEYELPVAVPALAGHTLLVTGSGCRLRDVGADPAANVAAVVVHDGGATATLHSSPRRAWTRPTSEFNSHLAVHADQVASRAVPFQAVIHAQPPYLVALSHLAEINETVAFSRRVLRWEPETIIQLPDGVGVLPFMVPGSEELMANTVRALRDHQIVLWSKHGVMVRSDVSPLAAVDKIEYAETGAMYEHLNTVAGNRSQGLSDMELKAVVDAFGVPTTLY